MTTVTAPGIGVGRQTLNFVRHFFEMCIPMCVGGFLLYFLAFSWLPDLAGWGSPPRAVPGGVAAPRRALPFGTNDGLDGLPRHAVAPDPRDGGRAIRDRAPDHHLRRDRHAAGELAPDPME